ncbi:hypothetical protein H0H87_009249 [Tephrocybe sp. NHM501043]|nr:hypothetical protein H0H87_009249 [Tephrocybe sp. NHM501043]
MGQNVSLPEGYSAEIYGRSNSSFIKDFSVIVGTSNDGPKRPDKAEETYHLYANGPGDLVPPGGQPLHIQGAKNRVISVLGSSHRAGTESRGTIFIEDALLQKTGNQNPLPPNIDFHFGFYADDLGQGQQGKPSDSVVYILVSKNLKA